MDLAILAQAYVHIWEVELGNREGTLCKANLQSIKLYVGNVDGVQKVVEA